MLRNYFKIAIRNLFRHKGFSFINIAGLAIGMSCTIFILLWVQNELSYDRFHKQAGNIYRITASLPELDIHAAVTPAPLGAAVQQETPEIKSSVRISGSNSDLFQVDERMFEEKKVFFADSNFFNVFTYSFIEGDAETALRLPEGMVITKEMAKKYFGNESALGKTIRKNHKDDFTVTAVIDNVPSASHFQFDFIQPMSFLARTHRDLRDNVWDNYNWYTYIVLNDNADRSEATLKNIEQRINAIYKANEPFLKVNFSLQALTDIHLNPKPLLIFRGKATVNM